MVFLPFLMEQTAEHVYILKDSQEELCITYRPDLACISGLRMTAAFEATLRPSPKNHNNAFTAFYPDNAEGIILLEQELSSVYGQPVKVAIVPSYTSFDQVPYGHLRLH